VSDAIHRGQLACVNIQTVLDIHRFDAVGILVVMFFVVRVFQSSSTPPALVLRPAEVFHKDVLSEKIAGAGKTWCP